MGGQDHLKGKILRIGHMGDIQKEDVLFTIKSLALALEHYGHSVDQANVEKSLRYAENQLSQVQL